MGTALQVAVEFRPGSSIDAHHRSDDALVIPAVIRQSNPEYVVDCTLCAASAAESDRVKPYVFFFH